MKQVSSSPPDLADRSRGEVIKGKPLVLISLLLAAFVMDVSAAMVFPSNLPLISSVFTERRERALAIGLWGAITGVAIALGPIVGGWLPEALDGAASLSRLPRLPRSPVC